MGQSALVLGLAFNFVLAVVDVHRVLAIDVIVLALAIRLVAALDGVPVLAQVELQDVQVALEPQRIDRPEQILPVDGLALLVFTLLAGLARDERYELRHALLNRLLGVFCDLSVLWQRLLHDAADVGDWQEPRVVRTDSESKL